METLRVAKVAKCLALCALMLTLVALLPAPHGIVSPNAEAVKRFRRYLVTIPPNSIVNLTGEDLEQEQAADDAPAAQPMPRGGALCLAKACRLDLEVCAGAGVAQDGDGEAQAQVDMADHVWVLSEPPRHLQRACPGAVAQHTSFPSSTSPSSAAGTRADIHTP